MPSMLFTAIFLSSIAFDSITCGRLCGVFPCFTPSVSDDEITPHPAPPAALTKYPAQDAAINAISSPRQDVKSEAMKINRGGNEYMDSLVSTKASYLGFSESCMAVLLAKDIAIMLKTCLNVAATLRSEVDVTVSPISKQDHAGSEHEIQLTHKDDTGINNDLGPLLHLLQLPRAAVPDRVKVFPKISKGKPTGKGFTIIHTDGKTMVSDVEVVDHNACHGFTDDDDHNSMICVKGEKLPTVKGAPYFEVDAKGETILRGLFIRKYGHGVYALINDKFASNILTLIQKETLDSGKISATNPQVA